MGEVVGDTLYGVSYESDRLMIYQILKIDSVLVINQIPKNFKFVLIPWMTFFLKLMCCFVDNMTGNCTVYISTCRFRISQLNCWSFLSITNRHHIISSNHMHWQCILYIQLFVAVFLFGFVSNRVKVCYNWFDFLKISWPVD